MHPALAVRWDKVRVTVAPDVMFGPGVKFSGKNSKLEIVCQCPRQFSGAYYATRNSKFCRARNQPHSISSFYLKVVGKRSLLEIT